MRKLCFLFLLFFSFCSCAERERKTTVQDTEPMSEIKDKSSFNLLLDTIIEVSFPSEIIEVSENYCIVFHENNLKDTLFVFSYCTPTFPNNSYFNGYKGYVNVNRFNIAIYDEKNVALDLYLKSLITDTLPNPKVFKEKKLQLLVMGKISNKKLVLLQGKEPIIYDWEYFGFE